MFNWMDASEAKAFGKSLALFFLDGLPPSAQYGDKAFAQKADKVLHQMDGQALQFRQTHRLNVYKKAQLGNVFKWTLRDAGVNSDYADQVTTRLLLLLK